MRITRLELRNFRAHADTSLSLEDGVTGLIGANESGKSSVIEAVVWALFGGSTTRGTKDGLRWRRAPSRRTASVVLDFTIAGTAYRIERGENDATLTRLGDASQVLAQGTSAVNDHVPTILGMTYQEFVSSYLCLQEDVKRLSTMLPTERIAFIRQVMGVSQIDEGIKECRKQKAALSEELRGFDIGLGDRSPLATAVSATHQRLKQDQRALEAAEKVERTAAKSFESARARLAEAVEQEEGHRSATQDLEMAKAAGEQAEIEVSRLSDRITNATAAQARVESAEHRLRNLPHLRAEEQRLAEAKASAGQRKQLRARQTELDALIDQKASEIARHREAIAEYDSGAHAAAERALIETVDLLDAMVAERRALVATLRGEAKAAGTEADRIRRRIAELRPLGADGTCPTCLRPLGDHYETVLKQLDTELEEAINRRAALMEEAENVPGTSEEQDLRDERERLQQEMERCVGDRNMARIAEQLAKQAEKARREALESCANVSAQIEDLSEVAYDADRHGDLRRTISELEALQEAVAADRGLASRLREDRADLERHKAARQEALAKMEAARRALAASGHDPDEYQRATAAAEEAREVHERAKQDVVRCEEAVRGAERAVATAQEALDDYDAKAAERDKVAEQHQLHERVDARLSDFRVAIAATIRPEMEELVSGFVQILTDGRHEAASLSEDFEVTLYESGEPMEVVSGGAQNIAALATRLALCQMIGEKAGHPLSLLVLDEPFDSIDETRRGNILRLIGRLRAVFTQVIVISHVAETRDAVDHVFEFEFDEAEGRSIVTGEAAA